jgi:Pentapeptide repeats (8 copies)
MRVLVPRTRPSPWAESREGINRGWLVPFFAMEWGTEWVAYFLSNWKFLEVLEYLGSLSVLVAVLFYFSESGDRKKQKHYQAWQVVNTAQGKGGSGGRIEALQELNSDRVPLVGVDVSDASLQGIRLERANLLRSNLAAADLRNSDFRFSDFADAELRSANFRGSDLRNVNFHGADLSAADLTDADLTKTDLSGTSLDNADLTDVNLQDVQWRQIRSLKGANIQGVKNAPAGFLDWAIEQGAIRMAGDASGRSSQR